LTSSPVPDCDGYMAKIDRSRWGSATAPGGLDLKALSKKYAD